MEMIEALVGAAAGLLTIVLARVVPGGQRWVYAVGLLTLPSLYAMWAYLGGEQALIAKELAYGIPFYVAGLVFAFVSVRQSALVVGAFWILHAVWDLVHDRFFANPGVPGWYPVFCFSVDLVVGLYLLWLWRRIPDGNLRAAA